MNLFAIRISKDWVELRSSAKPIKGLRSTITKTLPVQVERRVQDGWVVTPNSHPFYPDGLPHWTYKLIEAKRKVKMSHTSWSGGRKVGVFPTWAFYGLCPVPSLGCAITVPKSKAATLVEKLRKREHKAIPQGDRAGDAQPVNL
jgi:hypothetical protein